MPEKSSDTDRAASHPTELERAIRACRSAFAACAMFSLAINVLMLTMPIYMLQVYGRVLTTGRVETLVMLTLIATIALAVMCALDALRTSVTIRVGCWLNEQLGPAYLACAVRGRLKGELSGAEPLRDISQIQNFIATQGLIAFFDAPWVPIFVALIWILHPMLGLVALSSAVLLFVLSIVNEMATRKANQIANHRQIEATLLADATIRNAEIVQAMHILPAMTDRWAAVNETVIDALRRSGDVGGLVLATTKFVRFFVQVAILGVGAWLVVNSQLSAGAMIAGSILLGRALAPVELAIAVWRNFIAARFSYDRLKKTIGDYPAPLKRTRLPAPRGSVVVEEISYLTPNTAHLILSQVSCTVEPGEVLAIIGPSGAGKSTLCRLMVGLSIPNVGEIRLDGSPIHHWDPAQFGRHVGFLPQDVELFAGSVRDNIARMQVIDDEAVVNAATLACAHDMIQHLPQGYDTRVGDGGVRLSGGQRQRVGLARAVFGSPRFIVLDEPNANLDQAGEAALSEAIFELKQTGVALVIVGHRPSTLSAADKILFLKEGHVAMFGQRDQVLNALQEPSAGSLPETNSREGSDHNGKLMRIALDKRGWPPATKERSRHIRDVREKTSQLPDEERLEKALGEIERISAELRLEQDIADPETNSREGSDHNGKLMRIALDKRGWPPATKERSRHIRDVRERTRKSAVATVRAAGMPRFMRLSEVEAVTGLKRSSLYMMIHKGTFPAAVRIAARACAWVASEVEDWLARRIAARDDGTAERSLGLTGYHRTEFSGDA